MRPELVADSSMQAKHDVRIMLPSGTTREQHHQHYNVTNALVYVLMLQHHVQRHLTSLRSILGWVCAEAQTQPSKQPH